MEAVRKYGIPRLTLCRKIDKNKLNVEEKRPGYDPLLGDEGD